MDGRFTTAALLTSLMVLLGTANSQAQSLPPEKPQLWEGFKKLKDVKVPYRDFIEDAVLTVIVPAFEPAASDGKSYQILDLDDAKAVKKFRNKIGEKAILQLETCRIQGLRRCPVSNLKSRSYGTAFVRDGAEVTMCRHGLHNWYVLALKNNPINMEDLSPPMKLINSKGKVVYDSSKTPREKLLKIAFANGDARMQYLFDYGKKLPTDELSFNVKASDVMQYRSPVPLVKSYSPALRASFHSIVMDTEVYAFGYPAAVKGYNAAKLNGNELAVSHGHVYLAMPERGTYELTNFSYGGISGGPVMTASGEILGMSCGAFGVKEAAKKPKDVHAIMTVIDKNYLPRLWQNLRY
jgi:hypothetical protein